jgi:hypothetical protein
LVEAGEFPGSAGPSWSRVWCVSSRVDANRPPIARPIGVRRNARQIATRKPSGSFAAGEWVLMPPLVMAMLLIAEPQGQA